MTEAELRTQLVALHLELPKAGLVTWTSGNISARASAGMLIKPSGVTFPDLTPDQLVQCDLDGNPLETHLKPSSDTATHAYIYRHLPEVGGIVHTHSPYATAWAATEAASISPIRKTAAENTVTSNVIVTAIGAPSVAIARIRAQSARHQRPKMA